MSTKSIYMLNIRRDHVKFDVRPKPDVRFDLRFNIKSNVRSNPKPDPEPDPIHVISLPFFRTKLLIHITKEIKEELTLFNVSYKILYAWDSVIHVDHIILRVSSLQKPPNVECYLKLVVYE